VLDQLADLATRYWEAAADYDIRGLVDEFKQSLRDELNYLKEMQNARRFRGNFAQHPIIRVPRVYADLTNQEVLVMDKVSGIKVNDIEALDAAGINRAQLAENATLAVLQMVYEDGFFHADPHPGNLFVQPDGKITLIDFGMVGRLNRPTLNNMLGFLLAVGTRNPEALADAALDLTVSQLPVDRNALVRDAEKLLYDFYGLALDKLSAQALLERVNMIFLKHKLVLPSNLALMLRMLTLVEGVGRLIYPQFNYFKTMTSYTRRRFTNRLSLEGLNEEAPRLLVDTAGLTYDLPFRLENIYRTVAAEGVVIEPMERDTEYFLVWLERQVNRLGLAILTGAFIVCTARLVPYFLTTAPGWVALLTLACFFGSVVAGALFASDSIRKLRMK
jgi:ubiquinone biosynthesis protein